MRSQRDDQAGALRDPTSERSPARDGIGAVEEARAPELSERQRQVLEVVATGFLFDGSASASSNVASLVPGKISPASVRSTMAELTDMGLLEKRHASAGRVPSERGLRHFVQALMRPSELGAWDRRALSDDLGTLPAVAPVTALRQATDVLSCHTGQLGFVLTMGIGSVQVRHVSLVRVSSERLLAVVVSRSGQAHQRVIDDPGTGDQAELDRIASLLNERVADHTLAEIRAELSRDLDAMRGEADRLAARALQLGLRICADSGEEFDLVLATRLALLDKPEFQDPERVHELLEALEAQEQLAEVLDRILSSGDVSVTFGADLARTGLHRCALVAAPYRDAASGVVEGAVGVIGPNRMDYGRIIPLVGFCSQLLTEKLHS
ncbi:MAG: heat-inducible transcriptional repressor HrcA [Myxococcota bacterium]